MRSLDEWIGKDDDQPVPPRVRIRVFDRYNGKCHKCTRKVMAGEPWTCEHLKAIVNAPLGISVNRESNLRITCSNCLPEKNADDVAEKSDIYHKRARHLGIDLKPKKRWGWRG